MHIETSKKRLAKSAPEVFAFLTDFNNFERLMPDSVAKFELLTEDSFVFALSGMPEIVLKRKEQQPHSKLILGAASDKLPFSLNIDISAVAEGESEVQWSFEGEFNAMMAMMVKTPITNFMNTLSEKLVEI
ncbi:MAG: SRPBCC family protein [Flavobacteriaceae bacterium]